MRSVGKFGVSVEYLPRRPLPPRPLPPRPLPPRSLPPPPRATTGGGCVTMCLAPSFLVVTMVGIKIVCFSKLYEIEIVKNIKKVSNFVPITSSY